MPEMKHLAETSIDHLRLVLEVGKIGVWELDTRTGHAWRSQRHDQIFGYEQLLPEWTYEQFLDHVVPEDREHVDRLQSSAIENGTEWIFECRITRPDGHVRWISAAGTPLRDQDGEVVRLIGHVVDITDTKARESRLQILTQELNHRVRNMLAIMRAMINLSSRTARDVRSFADALEGRIAALARTHDLFGRDGAGQFTPAEIVRKELAAFPEFADRLDISDSSEAELGASESQGFALLVHELITNAIKYGAFSGEAGRVSLAIEETGRDALRIVWAETGGPPVTAPENGGFGTRMIRMALGPGGKVDLDFAPAGLTCTIDIEVAGSA